MNYRQVQGIAKNTMKYARQNIKPGLSISDIRKMLENQMLASGAESFWYYDIGAFIFSGEETSISISGREYVTPDTVVKDNDIITIDLSPQVGRVWGDYARTVVIEDGAVVEDKDVPNESIVWMSHTDYIENVPNGFEVIAHTDNCPCVAMQNSEKNCMRCSFIRRLHIRNMGTKF